MEEEGEEEILLWGWLPGSKPKRHGQESQCGKTKDRGYRGVREGKRAVSLGWGEGRERADMRDPAFL